MQRGAQAQRTGPDHHDIGVHQAIVPGRGARPPIRQRVSFRRDQPWMTQVDTYQFSKYQEYLEFLS